MKDREPTKPPGDFPETPGEAKDAFTREPTSEQKRQWLEELEEDIARAKLRGSDLLASVKKRREETSSPRLEKMTAEELESLLIILEGAKQQALAVLERRDLPAESRVFHEKSLEIFERNIQQVRAALKKIKEK